MNLIQRFLRVFFHLLYHPFAFAYDLVATVVSFGKWNEWVLSVIPFISGTRILELGHGPGHLQLALRRARGWMLLRWMSRLRWGDSQSDGLAVRINLPELSRRKFPLLLKHSTQSSRPSPPNIFSTRKRCQRRTESCGAAGKLIVLLAAWPRNPLLGWLFKITGESPAGAYESIKSKISTTFDRVNFKADVQIVEVKSGNLLVVVAQKEET